MARSSTVAAYAVWSTAWGFVGAACSARGLRRVLLPHYKADDLRAWLASEYPEAAEDLAAFEDLIRLSREYFSGREVSFTALDCDLPDRSGFAGRVLRTCRKIPYGRTRSYSQVAAAAGSPAAARAVGRALGGNPLPLVVPCHRVICSDGRLGGFSAPGGTNLKRRMLFLENALAE